MNRGTNNPSIHSNLNSGSESTHTTTTTPSPRTQAAGSMAPTALAGNANLHMMPGIPAGAPLNRELIVQNHPDTVNNAGKEGQNRNAGKIQIASLHPAAPTNMNSNPNASNLTNAASKGAALLGTGTPDRRVAGMGTHHGPGSHGMSGPGGMHGHNVAPHAAATHLAGDTGMNTRTHIESNMSAALGARDHGVGSHDLPRNATIADEINTNPVSTSHPHANTPGGDVHTNQLVNTGHTSVSGKHHITKTGAKIDSAKTAAKMDAARIGAQATGDKGPTQTGMAANTNHTGTMGTMGTTGVTGTTGVGSKHSHFGSDSTIEKERIQYR